MGYAIQQKKNLIEFSQFSRKSITCESLVTCSRNQVDAIKIISGLYPEIIFCVRF